MNLSYRGHAYQTFEPIVDAIATQQVGHFLGSTFPIKRFNVAGRTGTPVVLTYRGIHYMP